MSSPERLISQIDGVVYVDEVAPMGSAGIDTELYHNIAAAMSGLNSEAAPKTAGQIRKKLDQMISKARKLLDEHQEVGFIRQKVPPMLMRLANEYRRINTRSTYGYSPQELFYGFDALTPFSRRFEDVSNTIDEDSVRFEARRRDRERQRMVDSTLNVMEKMRADALSRINPSTYTRQVARRRLFKVGDSVMKWVRNVDPLTPSWRGPLLVQQVLGDSTYKLSDGTVQDSRNMRKYFGKAQNMNPITIAYIQ
ncbi:conserved hypothetical protein [Perkinsus marinus ATCC 50983]|uniref:Uncharacterized protein n=1 Tax=Perkinsus marinus (strain ATCC 50983 / TXsc) TaxID=423536 RepID=C5LDS0_PERM5|nr:conserved hypothetical protein [Perkinsus marinus ATCC 50983]EER05084.1 conserved hypothetical protein [Perkinsus marinus ATCC 50983]|eukprot:XP_002773268.1 conserved hypothetical protein [Perkinsus marinus ATCC 50983]